MSTITRINDEGLIKKKGDWINAVAAQQQMGRARRRFCHYTSLENLFNILEGDSLWASNMRFSNDDSEGTIFIDKGINELDNYIISFCDESDQLSQWRGYCPVGGASIEMVLNEVKEYSILHADYDLTRRFELYSNMPLAVLYVKDDPKALRETINQFEKMNVVKADGARTYDPLQLKDIVPYLKNNSFKEERELRLAFINWDRNLYDCIRFRTLSSGIRIPYMVVKMDNIGKNATRCRFEPDKYNNEYFETLTESGIYDIWIPEGSDQEQMFNQINSNIQEYNKNQEDELHLHVFCKGHLPVKAITISPIYGQKRIKEQVQRYCYSKYWLRNVTVNCSNIPYISALK